MPRIRIVCISDTHGQHAKLNVPDGDVLIHTGDLMAFGELSTRFTKMAPLFGVNLGIDKDPVPLSP